MSADSAAGAPRIVVGVDGSRSSRAALRWAVRQARLTGGTVDAVIAWQIPTILKNYMWAPIYLEEAGDCAEGARKKIDAVISDEIQPADSRLVRSQVVGGHPAQVLLGASADADMLVVGSQGHGSFAEALLGSASQHCVHHAHCPVVVMRGEPGS